MRSGRAATVSRKRRMEMTVLQSDKVYDRAAPFMAQQIGLGDGHLDPLTQQRAK